MTIQPKIAVYGATGFTGNLVAHELAKAVDAMIIAGRTQAKLDRLAAEIRGSGEVLVQTRLASIDDDKSLDAMLDGVDVLINCAGPFSDVGVPVVAAAVRNATHYYDTTGEQAFMRQVQQDFDTSAREQGLVLAPASAYEYCVGAFAARLAVAAGARRLGICYAHRNSGMSHGTKKSVLRAIGDPGYTFVDGQLSQKALAYRVFEVPRPGRDAHCAVWIPGGESIQVPLFAGHINQVETCVATGKHASKWLKYGLPLFGPLLGLTQPLIDRVIDRTDGDPHRAQATPTKAGAPADEMSVGGQRPEFFVTAFDPRDSSYFVGIAGGDPYLVTSRIIVEAARRTLEGPPKTCGFTSVAALYEARDFLDAVKLEIVEL